MRGSVVERPAFKPEHHDINSAHFQVEAYMHHDIRHRKLGEVNDLHAYLVTTLQEQETKMQKLVFHNYHTFMAANATVKTLKVDVEKVDPEMTRLFGAFDGINGRSSGIEARLDAHKAKVEQLVGVRRLLQKVEFLFELPARLKKSMELGAYAQAVTYYRLAMKMLNKMTAMKSFDTIRSDAESTMGTLRVMLKASIKDTKPGSIAQLENATLLLDLGEQPEDVWPDLLEGRRLKFTAELHRVAKFADEQAAEPKGQDGSNGRSPALSLLYQHFIVDFVEFVDQFIALFINQVWLC